MRKTIVSKTTVSKPAMSKTMMPKSTVSRTNQPALRSKKTSQSAQWQPRFQPSKPTVSKAPLSKPRKGTDMRQRRTTRGYSGPVDYERYLEPTVTQKSLTQNGGGAAGAVGGLAGAGRAVEPAAPAAQGFNFLSMFGGIDGVISMMGKAQQVFKMFQQMGPIFKMISSFGGAKAVTASLKASKIQHGQPRRNRKARR